MPAPIRHASSLALALALAIAVLGGLGLAAADAGATTFPGANGRITASGPLNASSTKSRLELFTMNSAFNVDGGAEPADECQLTDDENSDFNPRYSQDGRKLAFVKDNNVWTMQLDEQGRAPVPPGTCSAAQPPYPGAGQPGNQKQLTSTEGNESFVGGWSPADAAGNAWIVFQSSRDGNFEVYKVQVDPNGAKIGSEIRLTDNAANDSQPAFRPDGQLIAFHSNRGTPSNSNIWVMSADGSNPRRLAGNSATAEESAPAFSPDGTEVAFQGDRDLSPPGPLSPRNLEIYKMKADGSSYPDGGTVKRLTYSNPSVNQDVGVIVVTGFDVNPAWSPDGSRICFHSGRAEEFRNSNGPLIHGQWELYTVDSATGEHEPGANPGGTPATRLTRRAGNDERCGWQSTLAASAPGGAPATSPGGGGGAGTVAPPAPAVSPVVFPAKLQLERARVIRRHRRLDVLAPISGLASGKVRVEFFAAQRRFRFSEAIDSQNRRVRFSRRIPAAQARLGTGIMTIGYGGDRDTRPQEVRLRAAVRKADLELERPRIVGDRLRARGTVSDRARGVVRLQLQYVVDGRTETVKFRGRIADGRWSIFEALSQKVRAQIARRSGTVHSYTLFTGYLPQRIRGEMHSHQLLGPR